MSSTFDLIVIGSGPGGYVAAVRASQLGMKVAIVEKDARLGGTCLLRGCIPTKSMLESAEIAEHARHAEEFGVTVGDVRVSLAAVLKRKDKVVSQNAGGVQFLMKKNKVEVFQGLGSLEGGGRVKVTSASGAQVISAQHILLATGSKPRQIPGIAVDGVAVMTSDELLELREMPRHLVVMGAGAVGVEFASVFSSFGCEVTLVELADRLVPVEDEEVSAEFARIYQKRGIKVHTSTKVAQVERVEGGVRLRLEREGAAPTSLTASHLLVAVGRAPVTEGLGLERTKVRVERGSVHVDPFNRTDEPGVYAIGDILFGKPLLAHAASAEGVLAVEHMAGLNPTPIDYAQVPGCTYSSPEIGSLGLTEAKARAAGYEVKVGKFPFSAVGKAKVINQTAGFVKIVADAKYHQILGVHIIGPRATDLIAEAGPLLKLECTVEELIGTIHAHPTLAEAMHEAAHATLGHAIHM
ncbi:MAG: dihydrolipoyl dehydrogenase [Deltaproteobacteria bacterium]|nr:dihydrolipoyl dehydrogenase [Deltaproteobacteria bacterium]